MATREEVFEAIASERAYGEALWSPTDDTQHSVEEFLVYMQDYLNEALHVVSRIKGEVGRPRALHNVRKIAGLAVACMEQNGAPRREIPSEAVLVARRFGDGTV